MIDNRKVESRTTYINAEMGQVIHHEYDEHGSHRLHLDASIRTEERFGDWIHYTGVATVSTSDGQDHYMGMTEYQGERVLTIVPCERVE